MLPNGTLLVTAGGSVIKVWDLVANKLLTTFSPHNKTITSLCMANQNTRLMTASLDRQIKFHDVSTFKPVHSIAFPSAILSAGVAPDDSFIVAGMADGLVQFLHRKVPQTFAEREAERQQNKRSHKYLRYTHFETFPDDIVVSEDKKDKEAYHDKYLRKFEYTKALDQVLKPYVMKKHPEYTYSVLRELKRRNGLRTAIGGQDEKSLVPLLQYLHRNVADARFQSFLIEIIDFTIGNITNFDAIFEFSHSFFLLDLYADKIGTCPKTDRIFVDIRKRVDREVRNQRHLMMLSGAIDLILTASQSSDKPRLTPEELELKKQLEGQKS